MTGFALPFLCLAGVVAGCSAPAVTAAHQGAAAPSSRPIQAASPSLLWSGVRRVGVTCLVQSRTVPDAFNLEAALCDRVQALAAAGAPMQVSKVEMGAPAFSSGDAIVLLVHASVEQAPTGRTITMTIRPHRPSGTDIAFFGSAPTAVAVPNGTTGPALEAALREALAAVLPWQQPSRDGARPL